MVFHFREGSTPLFPDWKHPYNKNEKDPTKKWSYLDLNGAVAYVRPCSSRSG